MRTAQTIQDAWNRVCGHPIEIGVHTLLWSGFVVLMLDGDTNGVGYFHQPGQSLAFPMLHGALWNAATFLAAGLVLLPRLFERRWAAAARDLLLLVVLVLAGKTVGEWVYIRLAVPELQELSFVDLGLENLYSFAAALLLGLVYFVARRGIVWSTTKITGAIMVRSGTQLHRLSIDAIRYLKAEGNYVAFHAQQRPLWVLTTMTSVLERLPADRFLRIHRSYAVNLAHVTGLASAAVLVGDEQLPLGRLYVTAARERVQAWLAR